MLKTEEVKKTFKLSKNPKEKLNLKEKSLILESFAQTEDGSSGWWFCPDVSWQSCQINWEETGDTATWIH